MVSEVSNVEVVCAFMVSVLVSTVSIPVPVTSASSTLVFVIPPEPPAAIPPAPLLLSMRESSVVCALIVTLLPLTFPASFTVLSP